MSGTVLITGGSRGIGAAAAKRFASEGWRVAVGYQKDEKSALLTLDACLKLGSPDAAVFCHDLSSDEGARALVADTEARFSRIDAVVNNAGISFHGLLSDMQRKQWDDIMALNAGGVFSVCAAAIPGMVRRGKGVIVNVSSIWGVRGASFEAAYSASKAAVAGLTAALAKELGPSGIRVNCVAPGFIETDMNAALSLNDAENVVARTALGRPGTAEDVADAIYFLASDRSCYITGQTLTVDGGLEA